MTRLRDFGVRVGRFEPGPLNAITDVPGVLVGHTTVTDDRPDGSSTRTGVTAVLPRAGNVFFDRVPAGHFVLNGAGEMSGLIQVAEWGLIETPVLLTNTMAVGAVSAAVAQYMLDTFPGIGSEHDVIIPLVGECDDSFLNDVSLPAILPEHVHDAIRGAATGPVEEGGVGAGTGMITCDFAAGIGTASRRVDFGGGAWTLGILVLTNFGEVDDLRLDGFPVGRALRAHVEEERRRQSYGSIIAVAATDAPVSSKQLDRICRRIALGIGRAGSYAAHGSGEIVVAFSTVNHVPRGWTSRQTVEIVPDRSLNPLYAASLECVEEAIWNALSSGRDVVGHRGNRAPGVPMEFVADLWARSQSLYA